MATDHYECTRNMGMSVKNNILVQDAPLSQLVSILGAWAGTSH